MITPLSPLVVNKNRRASFPQKVTQIVEKYVKKYIKTLINVFLNITKRFISFVKSVINREFNLHLVGIIGRSCCYLSEHLITISHKMSNRPVIFCKDMCNR